MRFSNLAKVQHYTGLNTNLDNLYSSLKQVLQDQKELRIVSEYKDFLNSIPLRSVVAVNTSPKVWAGPLREIHVSITGTHDYAVVKLLPEPYLARCSRSCVRGAVDLALC